MRSLGHDGFLIFREGRLELPVSRRWAKNSPRRLHDERTEEGVAATADGSADEERSLLAEDEDTLLCTVLRDESWAEDLFADLIADIGIDSTTFLPQ